jgi:hypothetical protein
VVPPRRRLLNVPPPYIADRNSAKSLAALPRPQRQAGPGPRRKCCSRAIPTRPETLIADSWWWHLRYRHKNDTVQGADWYRPQQNGDAQVNFEWAGAGNNDPFNDFDLDGFPDYRAQLSMGWIKRVLDAVNPYEARIRDFTGDSPATVSSMLQQLGPRFEGPVALNPDKNVIENVGLIELYETILKRGRDLSIDLSTPVSTPAIANALQLASTRLSDFYTLLGNEAYTDAKDPTIGIGSTSRVEFGYGSWPRRLHLPEPAGLVDRGGTVAAARRGRLLGPPGLQPPVLELHQGRGRSRLRDELQDHRHHQPTGSSMRTMP